MTCKFSHHCFLNCYGCEVAARATAEDKRQAERDLKRHRTRLQGKRGGKEPDE